MVNTGIEHTSEEICPFLGMKNDPSTSVGYPSEWNVCYHSNNHEVPNLAFQKSFCLTNQHKGCLIYKSEEKRSMPGSIRLPKEKITKDPKKMIIIGVVSLLVILLGIALIFRQQWFPAVESLLMPAWQKTQQVRTYQPLPTIPLTQIPEIEYTPTSNQTRNSTATPTQSPMRSPTITMVPSTLALDTPIGSWVQFIIHRTLPGESLEQFANQYNTNVDAIRTVNYNLPTVLFVDWLIIIPIGVQDAGDLPAFEAYQVTARGLGVDDLAEQLSVLPEDLVLYNNVPLDYIFNYGDWILVPRE